MSQVCLDGGAKGGASTGRLSLGRPPAACVFGDRRKREKASWKGEKGGVMAAGSIRLATRFEGGDMAEETEDRVKEIDEGGGGGE